MLRRLLIALFLTLMLQAPVALPIAGVDQTANGDRPATAFTPMAFNQTRVRAPELTGRAWLNTDKPLSLAGLKGKIVLLDFWTYGCINCIHIIPDLKRLEAKYANQLVVIGVHSAKFDNEKDTENIRRIILRYEIEHPVLNDGDFKVWNSYGIRAWPTQVLIDPAGYVVGSISGEGNYDVIDQTISGMVKEFRKRGELDEQPLKLALERARFADLPLAFPGKVLADTASGTLFIADSNHNRIVAAGFDGTLLYVIGSGEPGTGDGAFDRAQFYKPQGMALQGDSLYVADTGNHLIRKVDLKRRIVETAAGTGSQSRMEKTSGDARTVALSSPWDLCLVGEVLYIAMAGPHQIWQLDLSTNQVSVFAGTGREARIDGPRLRAGFAQPSGLTSDGKTLFVADSEANIIRAIDLVGANGTVKTLAGGDLFDFGDVDGRGNEVRMQHPLGVAFHDSRVLIADTYNHKIKQLDPKAQAVRSLFGSGKSGQKDGSKPSFYEPGGLSIAAGKIFVADTNNHAVRVIDLSSGNTTTLPIKGLKPPERSVDEETSDVALNAERVASQKQVIGLGDNRTLTIDVRLPDGYHLNSSAPQRYIIAADGPPLSLGKNGERSLSRTAKDLALPLNIPLTASAIGTSNLNVKLALFYCREDNTGTCEVKTLMWNVPVEVSETSSNADVKLSATIKN